MHIKTIRELGGIIKQAREDAGLTQAALASRIGVRRQRIIYLERGEGETSMPFVFSVLRELGLTLEVHRRDNNQTQDNRTVPSPYDIDSIVDGNV